MIYLLIVLVLFAGYQIPSAIFNASMFANGTPGIVLGVIAVCASFAFAWHLSRHPGTEVPHADLDDGNPGAD